MRAIIWTYVFLLIAPCANAADDWVLWNEVAGWKIEQNGSTCLTSDKYKSGITLAFVLNRNGDFSISFLNPKWDIPEGNYTIDIRIDNGYPSQLNAWASQNIVSTKIKLNDTVSSLLRYGNAIYVRFGKQTVGFNLTGTSRMLPELYRCAVALAGYGNARDANSSNPFSGTRNPFE